MLYKASIVLITNAGADANSQSSVPSSSPSNKVLNGSLLQLKDDVETPDWNTVKKLLLPLNRGVARSVHFAELNYGVISTLSTKVEWLMDTTKKQADLLLELVNRIGKATNLDELKSDLLQIDIKLCNEPTKIKVINPALITIKLPVTDENRLVQLVEFLEVDYQMEYLKHSLAGKVTNDHMCCIKAGEDGVRDATKEVCKRLFTDEFTHHFCMGGTSKAQIATWRSGGMSEEEIKKRTRAAIKKYDRSKRITGVIHG